MLKSSAWQGDTAPMHLLHRLRHWGQTAAGVALVWAACCSTVLAQSPPTDDPKLPAWKRTSACVAVMKREILVLADKHLAGDTKAQSEMVRQAEWSFALIGTAYKQGLRKAQADKLLEEAEAALKTRSPDEQKALLLTCQAEGQKTYKEANFVERALVSNRAKARIETLLKPK
ncbi:MAG: hypothetical protein C4K60_15940 [Ideonella sp. MAG2]|nr:MAG: hypothetical protein C4K60_15940 [Ideonella sp. MAG2]